MATLHRRRPFVLIGMTACLAIAGCSSTSSGTAGATGAPASSAGASNVAAGSGAGASVACPGGQIRFGIEPYEDPAKLTPAYKVLASALQTRLGCPVKLQIVENYSAEVLAMRNGQLEMAEFGPLGYVFASQKANAEAVASFADGSGKLTTYKAGLWVPAGSPIKSIADLKGHTIALSSPGSTSGDALPRYALKKAGIPQADVKIEYAGGHPQSLLALTNGKVEVAEINTQQQASAAAAGKFDAAKYRRIWESDPIPNDPVTVAGSLDPALKVAISKALLQLSPTEVGKVGAFLDVNPPGPMVSVSKQTYAPLFELAAALGLTEKDV
ncbi:MAG TPA: phosphate/phosphite/phosphonate ABC transporter substrate-binding protein [Kineosporiaceae bacterium]|nr:phosphate/phosphite/phosphonate ABC transporter substrate-binding protein [Kineosporiaceae bacterium]